MRLLHTSDWHLGRAFHGASLLPEQRQAIERIVELTAENEIDLVVIAGDLYDRAIPPADAVSLFDDALVRLRDTGAAVVAIAGNHDSPTRVAVSDRLLAHAGVTVRGDTARITDPLVFTPDDGGGPVAVYPMPFLEPSIAGPVLHAMVGGNGPDEELHGRSTKLSHHDVTALATHLIRSHIAAVEQCRTVAVAHTFIADGETSDSERELRVGPVGDIDRVGVDVFDGFDYVALGHLHREQSWDRGRVAYSGTPLPYSFSEEKDTKAVRLVEIAPDGSCSHESIPLEVGRRLCTITGTLEELLADPALVDAEAARVRVRLTDKDLPLQAMRRIQQRFAHAVLLQHQPPDRHGPEPGAARDAVARATTPIDLARRFWSDQHGIEPTPEQAAVLTEALNAAGKGQETPR